MRNRIVAFGRIPALAAGIALTFAAPAAAQDSGAVALVLDRLNALETQMLALTNRVEQLDYQVRELNSRVELLSRDVDFRFSELGGAPSGVTGGSSPAPQTPQTPPRLETPALGTTGSTTGVTPPTLSNGTGGSAAPGTPEAEFQAIRAMLDNRDYANADAALRTFISANPNHPLSSSAFFWLGEIYYDRADYQRAAETYAAGFANYPAGYKAADTLLKLSLALIELGRAPDACATLNKLRSDFPSAPINVQQRADQARISAGCN
ncbi:MAG: tol-pal system protein YbgF [Alphaproteobacteria bacterium]